MPIVEGEMFGELHAKLFRHDTLKILKIGAVNEEYETEARAIRIIESYIDGRLGGAIRIELIQIDELDTAQVAEYAKENDIDLIWSDGLELTDEQHKVMKNIAKVCPDLPKLVSEIESFLLGNGVYWVHEMPVWNSDALMRYNTKPGIAQDTSNLLVKGEHELNYSDKIRDRIRYLMIKTSTASFAKDTLQFILQSRRKSRRREYDSQQNYTIELNYNLTNYYFLMASSFDILARVVNDRYSLGITRMNSLALEKDDFIERLRPHSPLLADFLSQEETSKWIKWLKRRRNFIAHEAGIRNSPVVIERDPQLTEQELENIVDQQMDWNYVRHIFPPEIYESQRQLVRNLMNYQHNYEQVMEDVMVVETFGDQELFLPLEAVDYDFEKYTEIVKEIYRLVEEDGAMPIEPPVPEIPVEESSEQDTANG